MTPSAPIVRFAPSPTGFLHIGGARTALFNWLYARGRGGRFLLRIEDTDRERNNEAAVAAILDGVKWLGLDWDGDVISQFSRADRHREVANELLARGAAYYCYSSPAEIEAAREKAKAEGRPQIFLSPWRDRDPNDAPKDVKPAVRLKAPRDGETTFRAESPSPTKISTISSSCAPTAIRRIISRSSSTITTWKSPMSFAAPIT